MSGLVRNRRPSDAQAVTALVKFTFHGEAIQVATTPDGQHWALLADLCRPFGVQPRKQAEKLKRLPWAACTIIGGQILARDDQRRGMVFLNLRSIAGWLFTLNLGKVAPEVRERLALYQCELADAMADHFLGSRKPLALPAREELAEVRQRLAALEAKIETDRLKQLLLAAIAGTPGALFDGLEELLWAPRPKRWSTARRCHIARVVELLSELVAEGKIVQGMSEPHGYYLNW